MTSFLKTSYLILALLVLMSVAYADDSDTDVSGQSYTGKMAEYEVQEGDTFIKLARANNLGFVELRSANPGFDPWYPEEGGKIILPTRHLLPDSSHKGIVINLAEMRLYLFDDNGNVKRHFPIGVGREGLETPIGKTKIVRVKDGPTWYPTERMREEKPELPKAVGPGPDNPLGTHALYLGWPTFLIHGTKEPWGIGRRVSSGCIRLYPEGIKELFGLVGAGTSVEIVNQPVKHGWIGDTYYVEAHAPYDKAIEVEEEGIAPYYEIDTGIMKTITGILTAVDPSEYNVTVDWLNLRDALTYRTGFPQPIITKTRISKS